MNRAIFLALDVEGIPPATAFWIAMAVLALMLMLFARQFIDHSIDSRRVPFSLALGVPCFTAWAAHRLHSPANTTPELMSFSGPCPCGHESFLV